MNQYNYKIYNNNLGTVMKSQIFLPDASL